VEEAPNPEEVCQICENQGNLVNPEAPREEFEVRGAEDIKNRLADILKSASEPEDEEEEEIEETEDATLDLNMLKQLVEETPEAETQNLIEEDPDLSQRLADILADDGDNTDDEEEEEA
jgi:hypothetical protein